MLVAIDSREQKRIKPALKHFRKYNPLCFEMDVGDYGFSDNGINVIFEYKTISDFIGSVNDNRVFNQALEQSNNYDYHFVIIVGSEQDYRNAKTQVYKNTGISFNNNHWNGAVASLINFTSVLTAKTQALAFDLMERVALKCTMDKPVVKRFPKTRGSPAYRFLVNNVNGIGEQTALNICKSLGLWCIMDVLLLDVGKLKSVKGIGEKKANNILNQILKEYS